LISCKAAASSKEEDLALTLDVIMASMNSEEEPSLAVPAEDPPKEAKKAKKKKKKKQAPAVEDFVADVSKLDIRVGQIVEAWEHEDADKLFCEKIDLGEEEPRTIATGVRAYYQTEDLVDRRVCVLANLKKRKLVGFPSHGMVLCASIENDDGESQVVFVDPPADAAIGERVACEGFKGDPATANQIGKKKVLEAVFPDLKTDANGVATYKGVPLTAGTGKLVAEGGLADAHVA